MAFMLNNPLNKKETKIIIKYSLMIDFFLG